MVSKDLLGCDGGRRFQQNIRYLYNLDQILGKYTKQALYTTDQHDYDLKQKVFRAGNFFPADLTGPYLMVAVLYKLQVDLHNDSNDEGLTLMTCGGRFTGGMLQVPQLGLNVK